MRIFEASGVITPAEDKKNITYIFEVPENTEKLIINYSYNPKTVESRADALRLINSGLSKYNALHINPELELPVKNLITLSFDENGKYRGACHRQPNEQTVVIASENSTPGVINRPLESGEFSIMLNCHFVGCDVNYTITVDDEEVEE